MTRRASIVIPSFNHAAFLRAAVESALNQADVDVELIVVDDGSSDGSVAILREYGDRIRLLTQANHGAPHAIATGLHQASADILFILNSDDIFAPSRVSRLAQELERHHEASAAVSWIEIIDEQRQTLGIKRAWKSLPPWPRPHPGPGLEDLGAPELALLRENFIATSSNLAFRRSLLSQLELRDLRYCHDWDLALQLARLGVIRLVEEPLVSYRVHPENTLKEGADGRRGAGTMRFEILWVIARHAPALLEAASRCAPEPDDLTRRFWRSAPQFERPEILAAMLAATALQGEFSLDSFLAQDHPFRRHAIDQLDPEAARADDPPASDDSSGSKP